MDELNKSCNNEFCTRPQKCIKLSLMLMMGNTTTCIDMQIKVVIETIEFTAKPTANMFSGDKQII